MIFKLALLIFTQLAAAENAPIYDLFEELKAELPTAKGYCPWRASYSKTKSATVKSCPFCRCINDETNNKNFIVKKYKHNFLMLNLYPYTPWGNFLIIPKQHTKEFKDLAQEAKLEIMDIFQACQEILLKEVSGLNIGINIGQYAGASIPDHLHFHVVTRQPNEMGAVGTIGNLIPVGVNLEEQLQKFKELFDKYELEK